MGVARQISQHCLRSAEWLLGVDDTLGIAQRLSAPRSLLLFFASGVGGVGLLGWRRKRKAQAVT